MFNSVGEGGGKNHTTQNLVLPQILVYMLSDAVEDSPFQGYFNQEMDEGDESKEKGKG